MDKELAAFRAKREGGPPAVNPRDAGVDDWMAKRQRKIGNFILPPWAENAIREHQRSVIKQQMNEKRAGDQLLWSSAGSEAALTLAGKRGGVGGVDNTAQAVKANLLGQSQLAGSINSRPGESLNIFSAGVAQHLGEVEKARLRVRGLATPKGFADGGLVDGVGTSTSDSNFARLSRGEYILPAKSVSHHGLDTVQRFAGRRPGRRFCVLRRCQPVWRRRLWGRSHPVSRCFKHIRPGCCDSGKCLFNLRH